MKLNILRSIYLVRGDVNGIGAFEYCPKDLVEIITYFMKGNGNSAMVRLAAKGAPLCSPGTSEKCFRYLFPASSDKRSVGFTVHRTQTALQLSGIVPTEIKRFPKTMRAVVGEILCSYKNDHGLMTY